MQASVFWLSVIALFHGVLLTAKVADAFHDSASCHKGFIRRGACLKATWSRWSPWKKCIKTEWGGLQTRTRHCLFGGRRHIGYCTGKGSQSRQCSDITSDYRIRKNVRDLTDLEVHDLLQAMTKFKRDTSPKGYYAIVRYHGWPYICPWMKWMEGHEDGHCSYHNGPLFFAWHRVYITQFELGLQRHLKNRTLGIPYWDWMEPDWYELPYLVRNPVVLDPVLKKYVWNPFYWSKIIGHPKYKGKTLYTQRAVDRNGIHNWEKFLASAIQALQSLTFFSFDIKIEPNSHAQIHECCCKYRRGRCVFGMPTIAFTSWDPLFLLHHSQIDRIYALRKKLDDVTHRQDWTASSTLEPYRKAGQMQPESVFDRPLCPFCNRTINPFKVTRRKQVVTMRNSYHYKPLFGYKYDNLNPGGRPWQPIIRDIFQKSESTKWNDDNSPFVSSIFPEFGEITTSSSGFTVSYCSTFPDGAKT